MSKASKEPGVLEALGLPGEPGGLFELALTHRSYAYEQAGPALHNERLEFLGDAVVGLLVADLLFTEYPDMPEGRMQPLRASVVNTGALADIAREIGLGDLIRVGRGEGLAGGQNKPSILADTFEAVVAAAYLTLGYENVAAILRPVFRSEVEKVLAGGGRRFDSKGSLQEWTAKNRLPRPSYEAVASGPDHDKRFVVSVSIGGRTIAQGSGSTKKDAELEAAGRALAVLDSESDDDAEPSNSESRADARAS